MEDSAGVLALLKIVYTIYVFAVIALIVWFAKGVTNPEGKPRIVKPATFYMYVGALIFVGVSIHIFTFNKIPWVETDFKRHTIEKSADFDASKQRFDIVAVQNKETGEQKFILPADRLNADGMMEIECNQYIVFDVVSNDLTYGFGIFRQDGSMVTQMQVGPGSRNDLMWQFPKNGTYHIRSTEYSGPKGGRYMTQKNVIVVKGCDRDDSRSMIGGK
ncbi:cytochrome C oxidase subunit II [Sulfurovum sp. bin170]|uniref:cytochrome C oxidase subunit II n=1 Tax=Sulfurovum sp. bin170 TaxID=2695268 RepID=UPI0013E0BF1D|nr:cytochrome C oxidase subunit II [Sulfurovum sp. bin170]NEW61437.1 cytochrome C oxidase subunit II [Sulfurovum sp. bin170]